IIPDGMNDKPPSEVGVANSDAGNLHLKSRIVVPPMATQSSEGNVPGRETIAHYEAFAENPLTGLIITEHSYVSRQGRADPYQLSFADDSVIPAQKKLTDIVHQVNPDVKMIAQISHAGLNTTEQITGELLVSASSIRGSHALTAAEIHGLEDKFAEAAARVKEAGYDGVEIHSAHGYLLNQFYSPLLNLRVDEYGPQTVENRIRFLRETIQKVRAAVGKEFPIAVRLGGSDYLDGGSTIADAVRAAVLLEQDGIDLLDLSGGVNMYMRQGHSEPGWFSDMSSAVRKKVSLPVILTGGVKTPEQAEQLLNEEKADLIGVGRAMFRNPSWGL
ncbi:MAG: NADH:flavin oxidoreductase, partial [Eubacterium sp.]